MRRGIAGLCRCRVISVALWVGKLRGVDGRRGSNERGVVLVVDMEARIPAKHRLAGAAATDERGPGRTRPSVFGALRSNSDGRRLRRSVCCGRRFRSFSIRSARSASWSSGSSLTFCFAGSLGFPSTRPRVRRLDLLQEPRPLAHPGDCAEVLASLIALPEVKRLLSAEHFSVDGTLLRRGRR